MIIVENGIVTQREMTPEEILAMEVLEVEPTPEEIREEYGKLVAQKIRAKYSSSQELALLRQKDEKPDDFQEYFDFCEQCKMEAKNEML